MYFGSCNGTFYAADLATGDIRWSFNAKRRQNWRSRQFHANPTVAGDLVLAGNDNGILYGFDRASGSVRWEFDATGELFWSPIVVNGLAYVATSSEPYRLYAVDTATGAARWELDLPGAASGSMAKYGERFFLSAGHRLLELDSTARKLTTLIRKIEAGTPLIVGDRLFVASTGGQVVAYDLKTKERKYGPDTTGPLGKASLASDGIRVYAGALDGSVWAFDISDLSIVWKYRTDGGITGDPVLADTPAGKVLVVGSWDSSMYCLDANTGQLLWRYQTESQIRGDPTIAQASVLFGLRDGNLYSVSLTGEGG